VNGCRGRHGCIGPDLAFARTIIKAHGGRISAESAPDGGAIDRFTALTPREREVLEYMLRLRLNKHFAAEPASMSTSSSAPGRA
jgi:FixJ family two-component response regulator